MPRGRELGSKKQVIRVCTQDCRAGRIKVLLAVSKKKRSLILGVQVAAECHALVREVRDGSAGHASGGDAPCSPRSVKATTVPSEGKLPRSVICSI